MKQVSVHGPDDVRIDEAPDPIPGARDAVIRVASCGICGTDLRYVRLGGLAGPRVRLLATSISPFSLGQQLQLPRLLRRPRRKLRPIQSCNRRAACLRARQTRPSLSA